MAEESDNNLYQQNTELDLIGMLIPYLSQQSFLDIGAERGEFTRFFAEHGLKGVFFEPLPQCATELTQLAKETGCTFSSFAIDASDRTADFYQAFDNQDTDAQYFSSLHPLQDDSRIRHKKTCTVQCKSLNNLLKEGVISQSIGIIKIDTEGNDLNVLNGMSEVCAEILMCEFFMPNIYSGWPLGHPAGLIQQAKQLGFNHFFSIKRIDGYEFISLDNDFFIDKQWGNLVFISDQIYKKAKTASINYITQKENTYITNFLIKTAALQTVCDERLSVINDLKKICDERLSMINELKIASGFWGNTIKLKFGTRKIKNWFAKRMIKKG